MLSKEKKYPIICEIERIAIVKELRCVDEVVVQDNMDKLQAVIKYNVDVVFVGSDWKGTEAWNNYEKEFAKVGCSVVYLEHTDGISSSILRDRLNSGESALQ